METQRATSVWHSLGFKLYGGIQSNNRDESFIYYGINHDWDMFLGDLIHSCYGIWWAWIHGDWSWDWWCFLPGHVYIYIYNNIHRYRALVMDLHTGYIQFQRNKNHLHCLSCKIALIPRTENPFEANRSPIIIGGKTVLIHMTRTKASENVNYRGC